MPYPHVRAAFINAIAEEGTKAEAIEYLQKQWNETCALRAALRRIMAIADAGQANEATLNEIGHIADEALGTEQARTEEPR